MLHELIQGGIFYGIFTLFGLIGFAVLLHIPTKSNLKYLISKPLGLILFAYPIWLISSLKLLNFRNQIILTILFAIALIVSASVIILFLRNPKNIKVRKTLLTWKLCRLVILSEIISIVLYFGYLYMRGFSAQLEGTEKFMDLLLYMSAGKTDYFPFTDPWQAGLPVNYYYYGFYLFALLNRLAAVPYATGYNFSLGLIFISTVVLSFAIAYQFTKSKFFSLFATALVSIAGNIHYTACLYRNFHSSDLNTKCFYPAATRILDPAYTINEMPSYSFILGDMHPHVMGIPFLLTNLYLLILIFRSEKVSKLLSIVFAISLASSFMINIWDFIVLGFLFALLFFYKLLFKDRKVSLSELAKLSFYSQLIKEKKVFIFFSFLFAASPLVFFWPFLSHFKSPVEGIGFAPEFVALNKQLGQDFQWPSSLWFHFGLWGGYFILSLVAFVGLKLLKEKFMNYYWAFFFSITSLLLIIFTELFYFKDLFHIANPPYFRANTVFKLEYLAWILWSISTAVFVSYLWRNLRRIKNLYIGIAVDFLLIVLLQVYAVAAFNYPYYSIKQAYNPALPWHLQDKTWTLDGNNYIKTREPDDYATIQWINANIHERAVIAEAVGNSYTYYARIGVNTGMINPINWPSHEWTWRFHYPDDVKSWKDALGKSINTGYDEINAVVEDVRKIYESTDESETRDLISKYKVQYIYIGNLERSTYQNLQEDKLNKLGTVVFQSGNSKVIKVQTSN